MVYVDDSLVDCGVQVDIEEIKNAEYSENKNKLKVELFYKVITNILFNNDILQGRS